MPPVTPCCCFLDAAYLNSPSKKWFSPGRSIPSQNLPLAASVLECCQHEPPKRAGQSRRIRQLHTQWAPQRGWEGWPQCLCPHVQPRIHLTGRWRHLLAVTAHFSASSPSFSTDLPPASLQLCPYSPAQHLGCPVSPITASPTAAASPPSPTPRLCVPRPSWGLPLLGPPRSSAPIQPLPASPAQPLTRGTSAEQPEVWTLDISQLPASEPIGRSVPMM